MAKAVTVVFKNFMVPVVSIGVERSRGSDRGSERIRGVRNLEVLQVHERLLELRWGTVGDVSQKRAPEITE